MKAVPGQFFLAQIRGPVGFLIGLGQLCLNDSSRYTHCGIVLENGMAMEARPQRTRIVSLDRVDGYPALTYSRLPLSPEQARRVIAEARNMDGDRYSFATYAALALARFGYRPQWLRDYIEKSGRLICSAAVDLCYHRAGIFLFDDGRLFHEVTPGDLSNRLIEADWDQADDGWKP